MGTVFVRQLAILVSWSSSCPTLQRFGATPSNWDWYCWLVRQSPSSCCWVVTCQTIGSRVFGHTSRLSDAAVWLAMARPRLHPYCRHCCKNRHDALVVAVALSAALKQQQQ
jgi:hypothetical protein